MCRSHPKKKLIPAKELAYLKKCLKVLGYFRLKVRGYFKDDQTSGEMSVSLKSNQSLKNVLTPEVDHPKHPLTKSINDTKMHAKILLIR
jgi:hypothetical protein